MEQKKPQFNEQERSKIMGGMIGVTILFLIIAFSTCGDDKKEVEAQKSPVELRNDSIQKCFSAWDGSHIKLTEFIKQNMNDPNSFEHVETVYWDYDTHLRVQEKFRGTNAFGGVVTQEVHAFVDLNGNVLEILQTN